MNEGSGSQRQLKGIYEKPRAILESYNSLVHNWRKKAICAMKITVTYASKQTVIMTSLVS
jgi:hypothetical protein